MQELTFEAQRIIGELAERYGFSTEAVLCLLRALTAGGGGMAQFSHPELGGMGQWTQGGLVMIGDMFNQGLKQRVDALCADLAGILRDSPSVLTAPADTHQPPVAGRGVGLDAASGGYHWWAAELGVPTSAGAQNGVRYAYFRASNRLAVEQDGRVTVYDAGDHQIVGVSQQQGGGRSLVFTSEHGPVRVTDLPVVGSAAETRSQLSATAPHASASTPAAAPPFPPKAAEDPLLTIERLAELQQKGILTEEELAAKKADLLDRL